MIKVILNATILKQESKLRDNYITYHFKFYDSEGYECRGYFELDNDVKVISEYVDIEIPIIMNNTGKLTYFSVQKCAENKVKVKSIFNEFDANYIYIYGRK